MKPILIILLILLSTPVFGDEIQHFNTGIFGKSVDECTPLLVSAKGNAINPSQIITDINENGIFYAARLIYPKSISLEDARKSINNLYKKYEVKSFANNQEMGLWRNENERFSIQLSTEEECGAKVAQIIYIWLDR